MNGSQVASESGPGRHIALCLSGGGLRATMFHFGLVKALATHAKGDSTALASVDSLYAVSGGSIAAAHLIRYWERYRDPAELPALQDEMLAFAHRNIRDRVVRRWLLTGWLGRSRGDWLEREYRALLGPGTIADCYRTASQPPALHILATSFTTGELCAFGPEWFEVEPAVKGDTRHRTPGGHLPLAFAVAASSAFPPLFPPVALTGRMLRGPEDPWFQDTLLLSDGGVFDNLGFEKFRAAQVPGIDTLVVSNAGGSFRTGGDDRYSGIVSRNVRASDILMRRVGDTVERDARALTGLTCIDVRIRDIAPNSAVLPATQQLLRLVRTDLDAFPRDLAAMLVDHGYRIGSARLAEQGWAPVADPLPPAATASDATLSDVAARAADTTLSSFLFGWRDWRTVPLLWLGLVLLAAVAISPIAAGIFSYRNAKVESQVAKKRAIAARADAERQADLLYRQTNVLYGLSRAIASNDLKAAASLLSINLQQTEQKADAAVALAADAPRAVQSDASLAAPMPMPSVAATAIPPSGPTVHPQLVFIQFAGVLTREQITQLNQSLRDAGWRAQGLSGEQVGGQRTAKAAGLNEVRYSGDNGSAAQNLASAVNAAGLTARSVIARRVPIIGPNVLELWISR